MCVFEVRISLFVTSLIKSLFSLQVRSPAVTAQSCPQLSTPGLPSHWDGQIFGLGTNLSSHNLLPDIWLSSHGRFKVLWSPVSFNKPKKYNWNYLSYFSFTLGSYHQHRLLIRQDQTSSYSSSAWSTYSYFLVSASSYYFFISRRFWPHVYIIGQKGWSRV